VAAYDSSTTVNRMHITSTFVVIFVIEIVFASHCFFASHYSCCHLWSYKEWNCFI